MVAAGASQSCRAAAVAVTAVMGAGKLREWRRQSWTRGAAALGALGHVGRGRISSGFLVNPLPCLNRLVTAAEESILRLFANDSQFGPFGPPASQIFF